jgi:hypothetical protein
MFTAADFKGEPVPAVYIKNGKVLNMMVDADLLTPAFLEEMAELARVPDSAGEAWNKQQQDIAYLVNTLVRAVNSWDLEGMSKPTPEFLRSLPVVALSELLEVCLNAGLEDKKKKKLQSEDSILQVVD